MHTLRHAWDLCRYLSALGAPIPFDRASKETQMTNSKGYGWRVVLRKA